MSARYSEVPQAFTPDAGIEAIWHSRSDRSGRYRVLPDGRCDLVLRHHDHVGGLDNVLPILTGPSPRHHDVNLAPGIGFVGLRFKPGHAHRFLGFSPQNIPPAGWRGQEVLTHCPWLVPLLGPAASQTALIARIGQYLAQIAKNRPPPPARMQAIASAFHASAGRISVAETARIHRISSRHLAREWYHLTGFAPKTYGMILQFQHALRLMRQSGLTASAAAFEAGYADQPHMTRAFRRFGGFTPATAIEVTLVTLRG